MNPPRTTEMLLLQELSQRQRSLVSQGMALMRSWNETFPRGTIGFRLARLAGESNTLLRWRRTRGDDASRGRRFELADDLALFESLPAGARTRLLNFEDQRIRLNYEHATTTYQLQRLQDLLRHRQALAQLRSLYRGTGHPV